MTGLLIMTTGHSDVQVIDRGVRWMLARKLHAQLMQRADWTLGDAFIAKSTEALKVLPETSFQLCSPKLDAILKFCSENEMSITTALVFDTRGDTDGAPDPVQSGVIVARRLRERLGIEAVIETYLAGGEQLNDPRQPHDAVIRREVVLRIRDACRRVIAEANPGIIVVASSGIPGVSNLVVQIVRLYGSKAELIVLDIPDAGRSGGEGIDVAVPQSPVPSALESFEARRRALELLRGGHLLGAWSAVLHLHEDRLESEWTTTVRWLYLWASSLPLPAECDIDILKDSRMAVRAALRVEFALLARDIPDAVHGTVAFFEAALWDHLNTRLTQHPNRPKLYAASQPPPEALVRRHSGDPGGGVRPFTLDEHQSQDGTTWYRVKTEAQHAARLVKDYLGKPALEELAHAIDAVRSLRNDVAHKVPTPARMESAAQVMRRHQLWSDDGFIALPLISNTLAELGVPDPASLRVRLVHEVERRLLSWTCPLV